MRAGLHEGAAHALHPASLLRGSTLAQRAAAHGGRAARKGGITSAKLYPSMVDSIVIARVPAVRGKLRASAGDNPRYLAARLPPRRAADHTLPAPRRA